jgi:hypothetical protein
MRSGPRRPRFYGAVLVTGFLLGGFLQGFLSRILPESPARSFFTSAARGEFGPVKLDLMVVDLTLGPLGVEISLLSVLGVLIAYLVARSLF